MDFDKIVQRMRKKGQKLWSITDIEAYSQERGAVKSKKPYKTIHRLVAAGILISIRKGMYLWNMDTKLNPEDFYWPIVKKTIVENYLGQGIIIGEKALAFTLRDYSIPDILSIAVPRDGARLALLGAYLMIAQEIRSEKKSLYSLIKKHAQRLSIEDVEILVTAPEHALLEALTTRTGRDITDTGLIERWLKKHSHDLRESLFAEFIPHKYISAANRLKYPAYDLDMTPLYEMMVRLIDTQGKGCHLSRDFLAGKKKGA